MKKEFGRGDNKTLKVVDLKRVEQGNKIIEEKNNQNDQKKVDGGKTISKKYKAVIWTSNKFE